MSNVAQRLKRCSLPIRLLLEAKSCIIALETCRGDVYRGFCADIQESINIRLTNVTLTKRNGTSFELEQVYLRGSQIKFVVLPDQLRVRYEKELEKVLELHQLKEEERGRQRARVRTT
ncbi:hypothetical protein DIPPA_03988 [Diplonema papillatum]|nr:hypothetical protein DIPPA_03988 [Diplonema papillatum]WGM49933.1 SmD3B [Diplonema papillatum]